MKKIYSICLVLLSIVIVFLFLNSLGTSGAHDDFNTIVTWADYDKQIAEEIDFEYNLINSTELEYNLEVLKNNSILDIEFIVSELSSPVIFQVMSKGDLLNTLEFSNNDQSQITLSEGIYTIKLIFNSGEGIGSIKWKLI